MEEALRSLLLQSAAVKATVQANVGWGLRPQGAALPGVALFEVGGLPSLSFSGPAEWARSRVQADCWARTYKEARGVADAIGGREGVLHGFRGTIGDVRLRTMVIARRTDDDRDGEGPLYRTSLDLLVWHDG
jgi:hypothetical protein